MKLHVKGKAVSVFNYLSNKPWKSGGIDSSIHNSGIRWRCAVNFMTRLLYFQRNSLSYPFDKRLGGHHSQSWHCGEEKVLNLPGIQWSYVQQSKLKTLWLCVCLCVCGNKHYVAYVVEIVVSCSVVLLVGVSMLGDINTYKEKWTVCRYHRNNSQNSSWYYSSGWPRHDTQDL
jgi:hypothetical protein